MFTEDWFSDDNCKTLQDLYYRTERITGDIVEVGCWEGKSTCALANACWPLNVRAVDTWRGSPGEDSERLASERDVYAEFRRNIVARTNMNVWPYQMTWQSYFETHRDRVKFCFIDAAHTYDQVRGNIETVLPLLVDHGVICGDDAHHPPVWNAAADVLGSVWRCGTNMWAWQKTVV